MLSSTLASFFFFCRQNSFTTFFVAETRRHATKLMHTHKKDTTVYFVGNQPANTATLAGVGNNVDSKLPFAEGMDVVGWP